jgi:hypothetical protein
VIAIGIDCGLTGAIAILDGDELVVHDMPIVGGGVDGSALSELLRAASDGHSVMCSSSGRRRCHGKVSRACSHAAAHSALPLAFSPPSACLTRS